METISELYPSAYLCAAHYRGSDSKNTQVAKAVNHMKLSRRLIACLGAVAIALISAATGEISWQVAINTAIGAIMAYLGLIGIQDIVATAKGTKK